MSLFKRLKPTDKILSASLLFVALLLLRHQMVLELDFDYPQALAYDLYIGWLHDLAGVLVAIALGQILWGVFFIPQTISWVLGAVVLWGTALANVLHFRFFQSRLEWWIVELHWQDLLVIGDSALALAELPAILGSAFFFCGALLAVFLRPLPPPASRLKASAKGLTLLVLVYLLARYPIWTEQARINVLNNHTLKMWLEEWGGSTLVLGRAIPAQVDQWESQIAQAPAYLAAYRDSTEGLWPTDALPPATSPQGLSYYFSPDPQRTEQLRQQFGLPLHGSINVIVLFVESWRIFELEHPEIAPWVFPRLRAILQKHSVFFPQAYTSSLTAGPTVRGQFSTLCSMLPNITGPAVYLAYSNLKIRCLQQLFQENGYQTLWMNTLSRSFHNSDLFESLHGTQTFYDEAYFRQQGITETVGSWGLADHLFLAEALKILQALGEKEPPFFANLLTISTHHPYDPVPGISLPAELTDKVGSHKAYLGYLSRLRYADGALSDFIEQFLASPLADDTILVMLGDHSISLEPHIALSPLQKKELQFRIPVALISRHPTSPRRIVHPVHQIDIAPTLARIAGISGEVTWLGKGLLSGAGSVWVFQDQDALFYRTPSRGCYQLLANQPLHCQETPNFQDLLLPHSSASPASAGSMEKEAIADIPAQTRFFQNVIQANRLAILLNQIRP